MTKEEFLKRRLLGEGKQWFKGTKLSYVYQDYIVNPFGDEKIDKWFVVTGRGKYVELQEGDWLFVCDNLRFVEVFRPPI